MKPQTPSTRRTPKRRRAAERSARSRGAVIILALLGAFMIAGMIGYVFNTGRHAQLRQQTQNAADAAAISGAGYVARSFNTVAMNNVEVSRLIAVVQMLDSVPLAAEYTLLDVEATLKRVDQQRSHGVCPIADEVVDRLAQDATNRHGPLFSGMEADLRRLIRNNLTPAIDNDTGDVLDDIAEDLEDQIRQLEDMDQFFNHSGYDVREMTFYDSRFGRGELWKAMESLDAISTATMEHLRELTNTTARESGLRNMHGRGGEAVTGVVIAESPVAWRRYAFDDFRDPVVRGRLPGWVDDRVTNRGPYDTIFGWRAVQQEPTVEEPNPDYFPTRPQSGFGSRWSGGPRSTTTPTRPAGYRPTGYTTYGTWQWLSSIVDARIDRHEVLYESQFVTRVNRMGGNKLNFLWAGSAQPWVFLDPQWITSFSQAEQIIAARTPRAAYTQFIRVRLGQEYTFLPYDNALLRAIGVSDNVSIGGLGGDDWDIIRPRGGWTRVPGVPAKSCDHVWDDAGTWDYQTDEVRALVNSPDKGNHVNAIRNNNAYTLYKFGGQELQPGDAPELATRVRFPVVVVPVEVVRFVWAGMNVGPEIQLRDPNNFASRADLPAPIDFDHTAMPRPIDGAVGRPGSPFTFLGVAKQPNTAPMWSQLFSTSAYDGHAAIAQVSIFNNHSWDLWTQMWHAQLEPVQQYDQWVNTMYSTTNDGEQIELIDYLRALETLAPVMLNH